MAAFPGGPAAGAAALYLPGEGNPRAGLVLIPGAVPQSRNDPRIVVFAQTLARTGFAVLVPDIRERVRFIVGVGGYHDFTRAAYTGTKGISGYGEAPPQIVKGEAASL